MHAVGRLVRRWVVLRLLLAGSLLLPGAVSCARGQSNPSADTVPQPPTRVQEEGVPSTDPAAQIQSISGTVYDPSGAVVPGAILLLLRVGTAPRDSLEIHAQSGPMGEYQLSAGPGSYFVVAQVAGFARFQSQPIRIDSIRTRTQGSSTRIHRLDVHLKLAALIENIDVPEGLDPTGPGGRNGSTIVLGEREIANMPLDSAGLLGELEGIAGGPDFQLYIDGYSGAKLPPRSSIREIRINPNAYSAQNDVSPGNGLIQVATRPGTDTLHGQAYLFGDTSGLNAGNPYAPAQPPYYAFASGAVLSGPLHRKVSYNLIVDQGTDQINSIISAQVLDSGLNPAPFNQALPAPSSSLNISPRLDWQAGPQSTMIFRYILDRELQTNAGVGQLALPSQGFDSRILTQTVQLSHSQIVGLRLVNDARFQYIRTRTSKVAQSTAPTVLVQGAFTGGGNNLGSSSDHQDRYEAQDYISYARGRHFLNFGTRLRVDREANRSLTGYNGEFIFADLAAYQATLQMSQSGNPGAAGPSEFVLTTGVPDAEVAIADAAWFLEDDWKLRPNLTLSSGLRVETQTYSSHRLDWAPRLGFTWGFASAKKGPKKSDAPRYILRAGTGLFYRRFGPDSALNVQRLNGVAQQQDVIASPDFYPFIPAAPALGAQAASTIFRLSPTFRAPYFLGSTLALDHPLGRYGTASVTYLYNRGVHTQLTENINAPLPGTYTPSIPSSGVRPLGGDQNIYQYQSAGVYRSQRLSANLILRFASRYTLYGYYTLRHDQSDADAGGFPSNQYHLGLDEGRSDDDIRHAVTFGGTANLPIGFHATGYLRATTGAPFNIVVGQDLNGDTQFNDRPAFATDLTRATVLTTRWGAFDTSPIAGQTIIPRNFGQGPGYQIVNFALGKSFAFGPDRQSSPGVASKAHASRRYVADLWAEAQNLLNHPNLSAPIGTLGSPLFGKSPGLVGASLLSPDRIIDLQFSLQF